MPPDPKPPKPLNQIADEMYTALAKTDGERHLALSHGLNVVLQHQGDRWLLKLGRQKVYPSELETVLCKRAFRLEDAATETRLDPTTTGWHVVVIDWASAVPQTKPQPPKKGARP